MKIGIFTDTYFPQVSGVATSIQTLKRGLEENGHEVLLFTTTDPNENKEEDIKNNIIRFSSIPYAGFKDRRIAYRGIIEAAEVAKKFDLDIVHTQTEFSLGLIGKHVAKKLSIPIIHTYHTMYQDYTHYFMNGKVIGSRTVKVLVNRYLKNIDGVVAPSEDVKHVLLSYRVLSGIRVIPTGVEIKPRIESDSSSFQDKLDSLNITKNTPIALFLGRISPEKNIENLIKIFKDVVKDIPDSKLLIAGDGPQKVQLEHLVQRLKLTNSVIFLGMVDHNHTDYLYQISNVFVSISKSETQGLTFLESLSNGTPIIAFKNEYLQSIVKNNSMGKLITNKNNLKEAIETYLKNEKHTIDEKDLIDISSKKFVNDVLDFYNTVLDGFYLQDKSSLKNHLNKIFRNYPRNRRK